MHHDDLRRMTRGNGEPRRAAFERGDAFLQHGTGWIADARVDVAKGLQAKQRGGVINIIEYERRGLIDRRRARAGCWIRLGAGMDRQCGKARVAFNVAHWTSGRVVKCKWPSRAIAAISAGGGGWRQGGANALTCR